MMVQLERVVKRRGRDHVLKGVTLRLDPGQVIALSGPNGAGKTTLAEIIGGLIPVDGGRVQVGGRDPFRDHRARRLVVNVFQQSLFDPLETPAGALGLYARIYGIPHALRRVAGVLDDLGVKPGNKRLFQLSGGNLKKVEVAKAFLREAEVYVLDEPTAGLDPSSRRLVWGRIRELAERGAAVLVISHDAEEVSAIGAEPYLLSEGLVHPREEVPTMTHTGRARVEIRVADWQRSMLDELRALPGVVTADALQVKPNTEELIGTLRARGIALPADANAKVVWVDGQEASDLLQKLGLDASQATTIPMPPGPADLTVIADDLQELLPRLVAWISDKGLKILRLAAERGA